MKIHLVHNQKAGSDPQHHEWLIATLREAGHQVVQLPLDGTADAACCSLVVVAGGDGTVGTSIRRFYRTLAGTGIPLAIVPTGTANNIAVSLGVDVPLEQQIDVWRTRGEAFEQRCRRFFLGCVDDGGEPELFLESVGFGLLARLIQVGDEAKARGETGDDPADEVRLRRENLLALIARAKPAHYRIEVDGRDLSGDYLMVELLNIGRVGPGLEFSPESDPGDEVFEVLLVTPEEREALAEFVQASIDGGPSPHRFVRASGRAISLTCSSVETHIDDQFLQCDGQRTLRIRAMAEPLRIPV